MHQVINKLRERRRDGEEGFTLIELMVVVLIIAILLAIAIPTFLGARKRAQDRAAQSSLRNALTAAKTMYTDSSSYAAANENATTGLPTVEPSLTYVATASPSTGPKMVSVSAADAAWYGAGKSDAGTCFYIKETTTGGTKFAKGTTDCTGTIAAGLIDGAGATNYSDKW